MALDQSTLHKAAYQWQILTNFAGELASYPVTYDDNADDKAARHRRRQEIAARYLRYYHDLTPEQWQEVEAFARDNRAKLENAEIGRFAALETPDETGFSASIVGQEYRLLFGFAAQFTIHAEGRTQEFLENHHCLGELEREAIAGFLADQEYSWAGL